MDILQKNVWLKDIKLVLHPVLKQFVLIIECTRACNSSRKGCMKKKKSTSARVQVLTSRSAKVRWYQPQPRLPWRLPKARKEYPVRKRALREPHKCMGHREGKRKLNRQPDHNNWLASSRTLEKNTSTLPRPWSPSKRPNAAPSAKNKS